LPIVGPNTYGVRRVRLEEPCRRRDTTSKTPKERAVARTLRNRSSCCEASSTFRCHGRASSNAPLSLAGFRVIAAAGFGPLLPIALLAAAVAGTDEPPPLGQIRDTVVTFGALISRGNPGTDQETLGISHHALLRPVADYIRERGLDPAAAHQAIIDACELSAGRGDRGNELADDELASYWGHCGPEALPGRRKPFGRNPVPAAARDAAGSRQS